MIDKDIERLKYTITQGNKPNENDIKALNSVIGYVNLEKDRTISKNILLSKLIINVLKNDIIKSKGNYQLSIKTLKSILRISLEAHYEAFKDEINQIWLDNYIKEGEDIKDFNYPKWNLSQTKASINNLITTFVDNYGNFR